MSLRQASFFPPRNTTPPLYPDAATRLLSERIELARARQAELRSRGAATAEVDLEVEALRRQLREGGQLRAGDALGDGRYLLLERLGRGGFAVVWRAFDRAQDTAVAIKVLHGPFAADPVRRERFFRGSRVMSQLTHPAVVRVLEQEAHDDDFHYFVMELLPRGDLRRAVLEKRLPAKRVLPLIVRVGEALAEAHERGVLHRDVKPENILLDPEGEPKITDFDLVAVPDATGSGKVEPLGTFVYAAPESLDRPQEADARVDVYSLGMTAIFCLRGAELQMDVVRDAGRMIEQLPCTRGVQAVLKRATAWNKKDRYANAGDLCDALSDAIFLRGGLGAPSTRDPQRASTPSDAHPQRAPAAVEGGMDPTPAPRTKASSSGTRRLRIALGASVGLLALSGGYRLTRSPAKGESARREGEMAVHESRPTLAIPAAMTAGVAAPASAATASASATPAASAPRDDATATAGRCPDGAAWIPAGTFTMGSTEQSGDEAPPHPVKLDGYCLDRREVTLAQYRTCMSTPRGGVSCGPPGMGASCVGRFGASTTHDGYPVNCVDWRAAVRYCDWAGGRLPTEAEWEYAARGAGNDYPWGAAEPAEQLCWKKTSRGLGPCPAGSYPQGESWRGVLDMSGNLGEWTRDWYGPYPGSLAYGPSGPDKGSLHVVRGGSWRDDSIREVRVTRRHAAEPSSSRDDIGFRCVHPAASGQ